MAANVSVIPTYICDLYRAALIEPWDLDDSENALDEDGHGGLAGSNRQ
jgi:hypothetical protein